MRDFGGKVAVVTGGASGIGRALGAALAQRGVLVVLSDINDERLQATVRELAEVGSVIGVAADVTREESVTNLADRVFERYGAVNLLFNNAGVSLGDSRSRIWALPMTDWRWGFDIHVMGVMHGLRAFLPRMIVGGQDGVVVNTSSDTGGLIYRPGSPIYSASKAALTALTEALHDQLKAEAPQIKAGVLFPGPSLVNTRLMAPDRPAAYVDPSNPPPPGRTIDDLAAQMGRLTVTEPSEVAEFAIGCIEAEQFWMLHPAFDTTRFEQRSRSIMERSNPV